MIVLGPLPSVVQIKLEMSNNHIILEAWDPDTRLISFGGRAKQVIDWMENNGYRYVRHSKGIWEKSGAPAHAH